MYAIRARYHGPTNTQGSRFTVTWNGRRITVPYDHSARRAEDAAIRRALRSRRFVGTIPESYPPTDALELRYMLGTLREGDTDGDRVAVVFTVARSDRHKPGESFPMVDLP